MGTGITFKYITVFVYNQLEFYIPGLIDDKYLDCNVNITSMLLPGENITYKDGEVLEGTKQNSYHTVKAGLGRTFPFNLLTFLYYQLNVDIYEQLRDNITPNHFITHTVIGEVIFNSAGDINTPFDLVEGLLFSFTPIVNYKLDYEPWGDPDNLTTHDDNVSLVCTTRLGFYKNLNPKHNLSILGTWYVNYNPYETDHFRLGHRGDAITFDSLTGYLSNEVIFDNGILLNLKHTITPKPDRTNFYGKIDVLFDLEKVEVYSGVAMGGVIKLPGDIDLKGECGIGLDAVRESGPGLFLSIELSKLIIF